MQHTTSDAQGLQATGLSSSNPNLVPREIGIIAAARATLTYHPAIRGKQAEVQAQDYRIDTAKSARYPTVGADARTWRNQNDYGRVFVRQPLWAFGKIDAPIQLERMQLRTEQFSLLQVQRQLLAQTVVAYARVIGIRRQIQIANDNIAEHERLFRQIENRQRGQLASQADVQLALSRLLQARAQGERLESELFVVTAELRALTQVEVPSSDPVSPVLLQPKDRSTTEALALANDASILEKESLISVAESQVRVQKNSSNPTIYAEVEHRLYDSNTSSGATSVGIVLEARVEGMGFNTIGRVNTAAAQVDAAHQELSAARNQVSLEVSSLLANLFLQDQLRRDQAASVVAVRQTSESYLRQYESGLKSWLDVLNMQRELTEQLFLLERAENEWKVINLRLSAITGELDKYVGIDPPSVPK